MKNSSTVFLNLLPNDETGSMMTQQRILHLLNEDVTHQVNLIIKDDTPPQESEPRSREKAKNYLILVTFPTEIVENIKKLQRHEHGSESTERANGNNKSFTDITQLRG